MLRIYTSSKFYELIQSSDRHLQSQLSLFFPLLSNKVGISERMEEKINQIVVRVAVLLGYSIDIEDISAVQVKPLHRLEHGQVVGLYNPAIYPQLTQMFKFLHLLKLDRLKVLLFLVLAKAMVKDDEVRRNASNQYPIWISLHPTLYMYPSLQDISNVQYALEKCLEQQLKQETIKENSESEKEDDQYIPSHKHIPFRGLNYITNSCYMDSVLVALFAISNDTINTYLLEKDIQSLKKNWIDCGSDLNRQKIQDELKYICKSIQGGEEVENCSKLKILIERCKGSQPFHDSGMQDAGEFLHFLFNIFEVGITTKLRRTYGTNDLNPEYEVAEKTHEEKQLATPIIDVNLKLSNDLNYFLSETDDAVLSDGYKYNGKFYRRRIETTTVITTPYIVFNPRRITINPSGVYELNSSLVDFPDDIVFGRKRLKLHAVVAYHRMHYTTYIQYRNQWYLYNDVPQSTITSVNYDSIRRDLQQNGVLYFYS